MLECELSAATVLPLVCLGAMLSFLCGVGIGANDLSANFAMVVGSGSLNMKQAIIYCAIFELLGAAFMGARVSDTIRTGIAEPVLFERNPELVVGGMLCSTFAAAIWLFLSTYFGLPVSITHTVVGSVLGFAIFAPGFTFHYVKLSGIFKIVTSWVMAPLAGGIVTALFFFLLRKYVMRVPRPQHAALKSLPYCMAISLLVNVIFIFIEKPPVMDAVNKRFDLTTQAIFALGIVGAMCWYASERIFPQTNKAANLQTQFVWEASTLRTEYKEEEEEEEDVSYTIGDEEYDATISSALVDAKSYGATTTAIPIAADHHHHHDDNKRGSVDGQLQRNLSLVDMDPSTISAYKATANNDSMTRDPAGATSSAVDNNSLTVLRVSSFVTTDSKVLPPRNEVKVAATVPLKRHKQRSPDHELYTPRAGDLSPPDESIDGDTIEASPVEMTAGKKRSKKNKRKQKQEQGKQISNNNNDDVDDASQQQQEQQQKKKDEEEPQSICSPPAMPSPGKKKKQNKKKKGGQETGSPTSPPGPSNSTNPYTCSTTTTATYHEEDDTITPLKRRMADLEGLGGTSARSESIDDSTNGEMVAINDSTSNLATASATTTTSSQATTSASTPSAGLNGNGNALSRPQQFNRRAEYLFIALQVLAGAMSSFVHGAVAGANATAPFIVLYDTYAKFYLHDANPNTVWIMLVAMSGIALGMHSLGSRLVKTVGVELVTVTPMRGYAMQVGGTIVTMICTASGIPVSLSQCQVGAAIGCGITDADGRTDMVAWNIVFKIIGGWLCTIVIGAVTTGATMHLLSLVLCGH